MAFRRIHETKTVDNARLRFVFWNGRIMSRTISPAKTYAPVGGKVEKRVAIGRVDETPGFVTGTCYYCCYYYATKTDGADNEREKRRPGVHRNRRRTTTTTRRHVRRSLCARGGFFFLTPVRLGFPPWSARSIAWLSLSICRFVRKMYESTADSKHDRRSPDVLPIRNKTPNVPRWS